MTNETKNTNAIKPRRWFRFRLRTLLVMVTLLSVPLGWIGWELDQRRRETVAIAWIEEMDGTVYFPSSFPTDGRNWWRKTKDRWLGEKVQTVSLTGIEMSHLSPLSELKSLEFLNLYNTTGSDLSPLAVLTNLKALNLSNTEVSDLSPLPALKNLKFLFLIDSPASDLSPLAELKKLKSLDLRGTHVSDEQLEELKLALPNCEIEIESND